MIQNKIERGVLLIRQQGIIRTVDYYIKKKSNEKEFLNQVRNYHLLSEIELETQRKTQHRVSPCISIVTPLYNTPRNFLEELLDSVQNQTYEKWELCLADGSDDEHDYVRELCEERAKDDNRIVYKKLLKNEGIVGNTNQCLEFATGEYVGLLDHDDLLHPAALFEVVNAIQDGADFIYTDEMKFMDKVENSTNIVCKSGFGKDELRSHNYICHFVVFKMELLNGMTQVYRKECEGSQDYDMVLRLTEKAKKIIHIPKILYYWRVHQGSVAMDLSVKQYAVDAAKRAILGQLHRSGEEGTISSNLPYQTIYRLNYALKGNPLVSIFLWGELRKTDLKKRIGEILENTTYRPLEIIVESDIDNTVVDENVQLSCVPRNSSDEKYVWFNYAKESSKGDYFVFLYDQCVPETQNWIEELLMFAQRDDVCSVGPQINYGHQKIYFAGAVIDKDEQCGIHVINYNHFQNEEGYEANLKHVRNTTVLSALCMMVARDKLEELSGFDIQMKDYGDVDLCLKARNANYWNVWTCFAQIKYQGKKSVYSNWKDEGKFREVWDDELKKRDEYYHPFLKQLKKM